MNAPARTRFCPDPSPALLQHVEHLIAGLDHVLPGQAPLLDFVHHNTLHGFQHLPFEQALAEVEHLTGIRPYLSENQFRRCHAQQRIDDDDLDAVLNQARDLEPDTVLLEIGEARIRRRDLYRLAMLYGLEPTTPEALRWAGQEYGVFERIMDDIPPAARHRLLQAIKMQTATPESRVPAPRTFLRALWAACTEKLGLPCPEGDPAAALQPVVDDTGAAPLDETTRPDPGELSRGSVTEALDQVGVTCTLPALLGELTGRRASEVVYPALVRWCAAFLDEGVAAWHAPNRGEGFYALWRQAASAEIAFAGLPSPTFGPAELPTDATMAVAGELTHLGLPEDRWSGYLTRLALELPGWAGLMNWRAQHTGYPANGTAPASLADFLAVRLILDRRWCDAVCRETWGIAASLPALRQQFGTHACEFVLRRALYRGALPEDLAAAAHRLAAVPDRTAATRQGWQELMRRRLAREARSHPERCVSHTPQGSVWRLFRLAQHLGLTASEITSLPNSQIERLLRILDDFTPQRRAHLWLLAYERHYRQQLFLALTDNHDRGRWLHRTRAPDAQIICCMDDREEGFRRHLEELEPGIETFGAAGFFGVPMYWRGLDDTRATPLCPVVVTPSNEVREVPRTGEAEHHRRHRRRHRLRSLCDTVLQHELRRNLLSSAVLIEVTAPGYLIGLAGRLLLPRGLKRWASTLGSFLGAPIRTALTVTAASDRSAVPADKPRLGFAEAEQADRVAAFLRNIGLTDHFAPLVILFGHGSSSENNPHRAAYDCGACSGRHGGPNARAFAAMANRAEVRGRLVERGIRVPDATWFIGAEHDTCNDTLTWFDLEDLPPVLRPVQHNLNKALEQACRLSAQERCRRFASAPSHPDPERALAHVRSRAADFSQVRPELGHATNAAALIGRRAMSQGVFLDRRVFLISYDPTTDVDGSILEGTLLAVGPVGAGINLEYYFSTVAPDQFGCGTKMPHNVTGFFGVMDGGCSDLRTGLPRQMTEIHEAMRLLVVVEQTPEVLMAICRRQTALRELIVNGWIQLACKNPHDGTLSLFENGSAFVPWQRPFSQTPTAAISSDWYAGQTGPLPPALIRRELGADQEMRHA